MTSNILFYIPVFYFTLIWSSNALFRIEKDDNILREVPKSEEIGMKTVVILV